MSVAAIYAKRERRQWEPEEKSWNDDALQLPWEDIVPPLHPTTIFCLKNVFFFSHATPIQAAAIEHVSTSGNSAVIEAPTGSGKTLSFLIPLMERTVRLGEALVAQYGRPPLTRRILGVILSPSRTLAEQSFVVGKRLAARFPFNVQFALCDGVVETAASAFNHLKKCSRGIGSFLVTTPQDFDDFIKFMDSSNELELRVERELMDTQDVETKERILAKRRAQGIQARNDGEEKIYFYSSELFRFFFVVDEADLIFQYAEMKKFVHRFVEDHLISNAKTKSRKRERENDNSILMDLLFVGATVTASTDLQKFVEDTCHKAQTKFHSLSVKSSDDFLGQLSNRYVVCDSTNFLSVFVQLINSHASKKHFVFFNSGQTLLFMKHLLLKLTQGSRPILFVQNIYVMYEGMPESTRIQQYNSFLTHNVAAVRKENTKQPVESASAKKNQIFTGGYKKSGQPKPGHGAILLCTDVAAFGLDVRDVDYVYHFEPPSSVKTYVHRIGRVGRMGMKGSSFLLLPCLISTKEKETPRERKTTSNRFNTATNTKKPTAHLQKVEASLADLPEKHRNYMQLLSKRISLSEHVIPPTAPISATLRNIIQEDSQILKHAKSAAMVMCQREAKLSSGRKSTEENWFTPRLAIESLLLNS